MKAAYLCAWVVVAAVLVGRADEETDCMTVLQSAAPAVRKADACLRLRSIGTAKSVPGLAALLPNEAISQAARNALEAMPCAEAGAALRNSVGQTRGLLKAGVAESLGWRRDAEAVPVLMPLLAESEPAAGSAAAIALGRIGGGPALEALLRARESSAPQVRPAVLEGLLLCAEGLAAGNNPERAAGIYRELAEARNPAPVRAAAWRGWLTTDTKDRGNLIAGALQGADAVPRTAAMGWIRETRDRSAIDAGLSVWRSIPADGQLAVLTAHLESGADPMPVLRMARESPHPPVRVAAIEALAGANDFESIPSFAQAAAGAPSAERDAARDALVRLSGTGVREALIAGLATAPPAEQAELVRALGERGDRQATGVLVQAARIEPDPVRGAALDALRKLAAPDALVPLFDLVAAAGTEEAARSCYPALQAICRASDRNADTSRRVTQSLGRLPAPLKRPLLMLLADLGTPDALAVARAVTRDPDAELAKEAVRVLTAWPDAAPAGHLLDMARGGGDPSLKTLALRGAIEVAGQEASPEQRLEILQEALKTASRAEEKRLALAQIGQIPNPRALAAARELMDDPALAAEAGLAAIGIAEKLAGQDAQLADDVARQVLARCKTPELVKRAWTLRVKPAAGGPFIQDWVVSGPYRREGATGAQALFEVALGPEVPGQTVTWKALPRAEHVNLAALFPNQENCAAYVRARLNAPEATEAALLLGSDDGVKAWLNGAVVHSANVDRGMVADQDLAPITLAKGANELLIKVTQGGGGWAVCARIVGADGLPIPGLTVEPATAAR